jgi:TonB family protein
MSLFEFFAQILLKSTVFLGLVFVAALLLRPAAAAVKHFVWTASLAALLLLPAMMAVAPKYGLRPVEATTVTLVSVTHAAAPAQKASPTPRSSGFPQWPVLVWAAGFLSCATHFLMGARRTRRMLRRARSWQPAVETPVPVLLSEEVPMPLVARIVDPAVVLPAEARDWPAERLRTVLLHELVHVERRDLLAQAVGNLSCCLYWFHPLAWIAARQLLKERERACDDAVLQRGIAAPDYASHLVDLVRSMAAREAQWSGAAGMAERSDLETRVRDLLDRRRPRHPLSRRSAALVTSMALAVLLPLAAITTYAQIASGIVGVVQDPGGARIPNCQVLAKNLDGANQEVARCNPAGEYRFASIPPGHYTLEYRAPGFTVLKMEATVTGGTVARADANMAIGAVSETVTVTAQKPATVALPQAATSLTDAPRRIRVGGNVQPIRLLHQVKADYPPDAQQQGVEGSVMIQAVISKTGDVINPRVTNTVDSRLAKSALDAVSQWHYAPTLLNGEPVETATSVTVEFKLNP